MTYGVYPLRRCRISASNATAHAPYWKHYTLTGTLLVGVYITDGGVCEITGAARSKRAMTATEKGKMRPGMHPL